MTATLPKERPILFSDPMVRAIRKPTAHRPKTKTRRIIKASWYRCLDLDDPEDRAKAIEGCPYGQVGDRLWVREAWSPDHSTFYPHFSVIYRADGYDPLQECQYLGDRPGHVWSSEQNGWYPFRWRPSIHMPRHLCRLRLEIESVEIQRLQQIDEADAIAEGSDDLAAFRKLWADLNESRGFGWDVNPFVWVIGFKRITPL